VKPSWKNTLMIAIMARRPLASTVFNLAVTRPMLFHCVKVKPMYSSPSCAKRRTNSAVESTRAIPANEGGEHQSKTPKGAGRVRKPDSLCPAVLALVNLGLVLRRIPDLQRLVNRHSGVHRTSPRSTGVTGVHETGIP